MKKALFTQVKVTPLSDNPFETEPAMRGLRVSTVYFPREKKYQTMCLGPYPMTAFDMSRYRRSVQRIVTGYEQLAPTAVYHHDTEAEALAHHDRYVAELRGEGWV